MENLKFDAGTHVAVPIGLHMHMMEIYMDFRRGRLRPANEFETMAPPEHPGRASEVDPPEGPHSKLISVESITDQMESYWSMGSAYEPQGYAATKMKKKGASGPDSPEEESEPNGSRQDPAAEG